jgi:ankyrin repeat protein
LKIAEELIAGSAKIDAHDLYGITPLWNAAANRWLEVVEQLIAQKADINRETSTSMTSFCLAVVEGHHKVAKQFILYSANMKVGTEGHTAFRMVCSMGDAEFVRKLMGWGAEFDATDKYGFTAIDSNIKVVKKMILELI